MFPDDDLLSLSALQHLLFRERQRALIHLEQVWVENPLTVEGRHLHKRVGRPGLALDLMEELRAYLADRLALSLINLQQIRPSGFVRHETGGVEMDEATRKAVITAYQRKKQEEILHPFLGERTAIGLLPHVQAALLARHLRKDLDDYPAFFWK